MKSVFRTHQCHFFLTNDFRFIKMNACFDECNHIQWFSVSNAWLTDLKYASFFVNLIRNLHQWLSAWFLLKYLLAYYKLLRSQKYVCRLTDSALCIFSQRLAITGLKWWAKKSKSSETILINKFDDFILDFIPLKYSNLLKLWLLV